MTKVTNEQLFELLLHQSQKLDLVNERLAFHTERFEQVERELCGIREDVATLKVTRLTCNAGIFAAMVATSSMVAFVLMRLFGAVGTKFAAVIPVIS